MPSFEIQADIFTCLSIFDSPKGSSNTFKTHKNISLYFKRRYLIIYNYLLGSVDINSVNLDNREDLLTSLAKNPNYFVECQHMDPNMASIVTELQNNLDHYNQRSGPQHHKEHFKLSKDGVLSRAK